MDSPKSSFIRRETSKEDAILQFFRPQLANRVTQALDVFERMVTEAETLTKLGVKLRLGGRDYFITPDDLRANLDEFPELEKLANDGRKFLSETGYVSPRRATPITGEGTAPVGKTVDVQPIAMTLPGSEPVTGVVISPKKR